MLECNKYDQFLNTFLFIISILVPGFPLAFPIIQPDCDLSLGVDLKYLWTFAFLQKLQIASIFIWIFNKIGFYY